MSKEVNYTEKEDFLEEDQEIPGQKFCLLSFLSPEKVLASKDSFLFSSSIISSIESHDDLGSARYICLCDSFSAYVHTM